MLAKTIAKNRHPIMATLSLSNGADSCASESSSKELEEFSVDAVDSTFVPCGVLVDLSWCFAFDCLASTSVRSNDKTNKPM